MRGNSHGKPIVALDVDGTLGDYHGHFLRFAKGWFGREFPPSGMVNPGLRLWEFMGVGVEEYRHCKLAYRQGGLKRTMPAFQGASYLTMIVREAGAEVWICTSRPYMRLDNIDPDTREWLRRNGIKYDAVLFDTISEKYSKYQELSRQAAGQVAAIVDDLPELIESASNLFPKTTVIVMDQPYNKQVEGIPRARDCYDILDLVMPAINKWKLENWR
jgi:hypothetical protein